MQLPISVVPKLLVLTAFILSMLTLFAGSRRRVLNDASIMTLNTSASRLSPTIRGQGPFNNISIAATEIGLQDFYSVYVLAYCSGHYTVDDYGGHRTITNCSRTSATFAFDPDKVFTLRRGFNTSDVFWPQSIRDDFAVIQSASKAMAIIYIIGVHATGITSLISILQTQYKARASVIAHLAFITLSFVSLGVASSVASILSVKFVELINRHGQGSGISATTGHKFLGMTWSAVGLLFLTVVITVVTLPSDGVPKKSPAVAVEKKAEAEAEHA